jgi:hypothetical protein
MSSPSVATTPARPGVARRLFGLAALAVLLLTVVRLANDYLNHPDIPRPNDFLQVWAAGKLTLAGDNPYDAEKMFELQQANRPPSDFASMMWVPPWGLAVAMPIGALPINLAQVVWVYGQVGLIALCAVVLWRFHGGRPHRKWVPVVLAVLSGPVWWQTVGGQYAGVLLVGVVGFVAANRANRPVLAGLFTSLIALKPHLFVLIAVGLLIDAVRTPFGRRVVLGGLIGLAVGAVAATLANPDVWSQYVVSATGPGSKYAPGLKDWFNPTVQAWVRYFTPGRPFWVQCVPAAVGMAAFAVYWWRRGNPGRWPAVLPWVVPACLLIAPYGSWPSDLTLLLVPIVALAARLDERGWAIPNRWLIAGAYAAANVGVVVMIVIVHDLESYVWVAPVLVGCLLWARHGLRLAPAGVTA